MPQFSSNAKEHIYNILGDFCIYSKDLWRSGVSQRFCPNYGRLTNVLLSERAVLIWIKHLYDHRNADVVGSTPTRSKLF